MGTVIDHTAITLAAWRSRHSALRIAVATSKACLAEAGCAPNELDLLINAGLYRDRDLGEPALAALIQQDIGANPEDPHVGARGTFSFDVANGVCGPLIALQVVDGFLRSGAIQRALVVASDADPGHGLTKDFPFAGAGGALLCGWAEGESGLGPFYWTNSPAHAAAFRSRLTYEDGRNRLVVSASDDVDEVFAGAAANVARKCLAGSVGLDAVDCIVAAPAGATFATALAAHLGTSVDRIAVAHNEQVHTAALIAALHDASADGRARRGNTVLFVAAGAGVTAGAALYRVPG